MRKNKETILLAKIRRYIRVAIKWNDFDNGMPHHYTTENYIGSRKCDSPAIGIYPYYSKSARAVEDIAKKILKEVRKSEHNKNE